MLPQGEIPVYEQEKNTELKDSLIKSLQESGTPEDRVGRIMGVVETLLENDFLIDKISEEIVDEQEVWKHRLSRDDVTRRIRGSLFEEYALACRPEEKKQYENLERFLLWSLRDPHMWFMDWHDTRLLSEEEKTQLEAYLAAYPTSEELETLYRNNDAISVNIKKDETTGKEVAVITGVIEAKNHRVFGKTQDARQMRSSPQILHDTVKRYKEAFPLIVKGLDLQGEIHMPDEIDILPIGQLEYTIVQPDDVEEDYRRKPVSAQFSGCNFEYVPISRNEVAVLAEVLKQHVLDRLPEKNKRLVM
ncbi:hypothetical protein C4561_05010 [candidate division WWE3 bacterium]|jgi:hypothetical protein|uniref:Uncharacterized protein n=1 Tax=candidate division WWE3 bacterium TaxID=2053526 RepID=A0A3A4ZAY9_UNCKA|nr:MAG: hypothetical protein C4561_05010 [candidate division WWE3 bacterium]